MEFNIPTGRVGIFISGGLDSALLYHLLLKEDKNIVPLLLFNNRQQYNRALAVIEYLQTLHQTDCKPILVSNEDIRQAINEAIWLGFDLVYLGVTKELEEFLVDWQPNNFQETKRIRGPFKDMDKSQVVKLAIENQAEHLFLITHSCAVQTQGRCNLCNRCRERAWAFTKLGLTDPGTI
jgi:7-cyano-7-deazaguanine synthase in queuosine biosynthesis